MTSFESGSDDPIRPVHLALQGGGSHGALAWGVLDRLLEEPYLRIAEISGTSAGAMNAVVLASAYETEGPEGARAALRRFWRAVSDAALFSPIQPSPWDRLLGNDSLDASPAYLWFDNLSRILSPYELNPMGFNPLRSLLNEQVDFKVLNACQAIRVHVTATSVRTGQARVFSTGELTADALLASACLPQMSQAVEIDGEAFWDGGFSANPALFPLVASGQDTDLLIVQLNPMVRDEVPKTARDIINRINEISFNSSLIKELRALDMLRKMVDQGRAYLPGDLRLHMIHCAEDVRDLPASSKMNADWDYLQRLFTRGRAWAEVWLQNNGGDLGERSSFSLERLFEPHPGPEGLAPLLRAAAE